MKTIQDYPLILNAKQVSEILGVSHRMAYEVMEYKDFPLIKIGKCKRVSRDAFFNWLENQAI